MAETRYTLLGLAPDPEAGGAGEAAFEDGDD